MTAAAAAAAGDSSVLLHWSRFFHPWWSMTLAIVFELIGTIHTKLSKGATQPVATVIMFASYVLCVLFLSFAMDDSADNDGLDLGLAYASWSGIGTLVAALAGVYLYGEKLVPMQWWGIVMTIVGVAMINLAPSFQQHDSASSTHQEDRRRQERNALTTQQYGSI